MRRQLPDIFPDFENIPQFDGANDDNANNDENVCPKKPCFKCSRCVFKSNSSNKLIEHFHVKHLLSRKTKITRQTLPEKLVKIPQFDGADDDNDNEKKSDQDRYYKQTTHNVKMFGNLLYFHEFFLLSPQSKKRFHYCRTLVPSTATAAKERSPR